MPWGSKVRMLVMANKLWADRTAKANADKSTRSYGIGFKILQIETTPRERTGSYKEELKKYSFIDTLNADKADEKEESEGSSDDDEENNSKTKSENDEDNDGDEEKDDDDDDGDDDDSDDDESDDSPPPPKASAKSSSVKQPAKTSSSKGKGR